MHFAHPQLLWCLVAVAALALLQIHGQLQRGKLLSAFAGPAMLARLASDYSPRRALVKAGLVLAALACLIIGLAEPQWGSTWVMVERQGIDVVLAVDCSASMNATDVKPNRLSVARRELGNLVKQLEGNRLGLVGFAGSAFSFSPLTLDISATHLFLEQLDSNSMPIPGTSLGDAIRTALPMFPKGGPNKKVIVLLSDGEDHHSDPLGAAKEAAQAGVTIYTVGIGNPHGEPIPQAEGDYVRDASGQIVMSRLDDATLQQIAKLSGGSYVHLDDSQGEALAPILSAISGAERHKLEESVQRRYVERFQILLLMALVLLAVERWITTRTTGRMSS